jgi:ribosomal protein S19
MTSSRKQQLLGVDRRSMILPVFQGDKYQISTGNKLVDLSIREDLVGHSFGEFA